ncbi:MAG: hypothetical protein KID00_04850 [Clostridium argentinense]|uniref:hypothetical protein n=1 Tax=Clostridium butanoliproducens TaxID=2991837 RepID=UPI001DA4AC86|nr:hypothetical protein [Clostridium butanoliproducens]MBS5823178.1 hypothetical protein [Clostridium argentinense]MDU1349246.1 hypothetical protein [Clostridium argentinense]
MRKKVRNINKYRKASVICLIISVIINVLNIPYNILLLTLISIILLIIFFVVSLIFWRCPNCKEGLPIRFNVYKEIDDVYICPYCNAKICDGEIIK